MNQASYKAKKNHLGPRYEGRLIFMVEPIPPPKCPLVRPNDAHHFSLRTDGQETDSSILRHADTVAHHFNAICCGGGGVCRGSRTTISFCPQRQLPLAIAGDPPTDLCPCTT